MFLRVACCMLLQFVGFGWQIAWRETRKQTLTDAGWRLGHVTLTIRTVCTTHKYSPGAWLPAGHINNQPGSHTALASKQLKLSSRHLKLVLINFNGHMLNFTCGDFSTWPTKLQVVDGYQVAGLQLAPLASPLVCFQFTCLPACCTGVLCTLTALINF